MREPVEAKSADVPDDLEDDRLASWWLAILFATMLFAFGYWAVFYTGPALPPSEAPRPEVAVATKAPETVEAQKADGPASIAVPSHPISTDAADIEKGRALFAAKGCVACHTVGKGKLIGPDLQGVLARRTQAWATRMILAPDVMVQEDATARELLTVHLVPMTNQKVDPQTELPFLLAYLKSESP